MNWEKMPHRGKRRAQRVRMAAFFGRLRRNEMAGLTVELDDELHRRIRVRCAETGDTIKAWVRRVLDDALIRESVEGTGVTEGEEVESNG